MVREPDECAAGAPAHGVEFLMTQELYCTCALPDYS